MQGGLRTGSSGVVGLIRGTERQAATIPLGTAPPWRGPLIAASSCLVVAIAAAGIASPKPAGALLGGLAGLVCLAALVRFAPTRASDALLLGGVGLLAIPVDVYLGYQDHVGGWPGFRISLSDLCFYALAPIAALGLALGRLRDRIPRAVEIAALLLVAQYALSLAGAPRRSLGLFEIASTLHAFGLAWIVALLFRRDHLRVVLGVLALQVIVHSVFAVLQGTTGRPIGAGWLGGSDVVLSEVLQGGASRLRPAGLFAHPIVYAVFLVVTLPVLAAGLALRAGATLRALLIAGLGLGAVGMLLTLSRGAWLGSAVASALLLGLALRHQILPARRVRTIIAAGSAAALVLGIAFGPRVYDRLTRSDAGNVEVRYELNWIALRMIAASPLLGVGLNNFTEAMERFDPQDVMEYFPAPAHQLYLLEAAEAGLPALALLLALFGLILGGALRRLRALPDPELRWIAAAFVAALAGFLVSQLTDFSHRLEPLRSMVWCDVGLLFGVLGCGAGGAAGSRRGAPN